MLSSEGFTTQWSLKHLKFSELIYFMKIQGLYDRRLLRWVVKIRNSDVGKTRSLLESFDEALPSNFLQAV